MGASCSIQVPAWQVDQDRDAQHRFANPVTRERLKNNLLDGNYTRLVEAGRLNPQLLEPVLAVIGTRDMSADDLHDDVEALDMDEGVCSYSKRRLGAEMIVSLLTRLRNQNVYNFFAVVLSILALGAGVPVQFWALLSMMGLVFSRPWTIALVRELGVDVANRRVMGASTEVGWMVTDNKCYLQSIAVVNPDGPDQTKKANGEFLYTVNNLQAPVMMPSGIDIVVKEGELLQLLQLLSPSVDINLSTRDRAGMDGRAKWRSAVSSVGAIDEITAFDRSTFLVVMSWQHFFMLDPKSFNILDHPNYDPEGATFYIYDPAIIDISTAAYIENIRILNTAQSLHINGGKNYFKVMFVVGDQQTYDRICRLICQRSTQYEWCIPINGDFHFTAHTVACFHELYFFPLTAYVVRKLGPGFVKTIKADDDNVTHYKHYDHFYLLLTRATVRFLHEIFDPSTLMNPESLLESVRDNQGASTS